MASSSTSRCGVKKAKMTGIINNNNNDRILPPSSFDFLSSSSSNSDVSQDETLAKMISSREMPNGVNHCRQSGRRSKVVCSEMVVFCFDVLYAFLHGFESPKAPKSLPTEQFPLFVTWKLGHERKLRGCIGTFNQTGLHYGLREYAITSACKDSRFDAIVRDEFNRLHCSVSLLMDFEPADHYLDWELGVHGIRIEFNFGKGGRKAATYLPEVAVEQGWDHVQTIDSLLRKGGFKGHITADVRASVCVIRFQSDKLSISYSEYVAHKEKHCTGVAFSQHPMSTKRRNVLPPFDNGPSRINNPRGEQSSYNNYCRRFDPSFR